MDDNLVDGDLLLRDAHHLFFDTSGGKQLVDNDLFALALAMSAAEGLHVIVGVKVGVVKNDRVRGCQVDTETTSARGNQKAENGRIGG